MTDIGKELGLEPVHLCGLGIESFQFFGMFPLRYVSQNDCEEFLSTNGHLRNCCLQWKLLAIRPQSVECPWGLHRASTRAGGPEHLYVVAMYFPEALGQKAVDRLSQNLRCGTPEDILSCGIEQNHPLVLTVL